MRHYRRARHRKHAQRDAARGRLELEGPSEPGNLHRSRGSFVLRHQCRMALGEFAQSAAERLTPLCEAVVA